MKSAIGCVIALLVGVAIGYGVWGRKAIVPQKAGLAASSPLHPLQFVVMKGGAVFYVPQKNDVLSWYLEGTDPKNEIAVKFAESPCSAVKQSPPLNPNECLIDSLPSGSYAYAYDCSSTSNVCQDPGIGPGSRNSKKGMRKTKPIDSEGNAILVTITCQSGGAIAQPSPRTVHEGDTVTWLSNNLTWSMTLPNNTTCSEGDSFTDQNNVCNVVKAPSGGLLKYTASIAAGCGPSTTPAKGKLFVISDPPQS